MEVCAAASDIHAANHNDPQLVLLTADNKSARCSRFAPALWALAWGTRPDGCPTQAFLCLELAKSPRQPLPTMGNRPPINPAPHSPAALRSEEHTSELQ